jgi:hypothetical protein
MGKGRAVLTAGGILLVAWAVYHWLGLLIAGVALAVVFKVACVTHPRSGCRPCGGRGRRYHRIFSWMFRLCANCGGNGRRIHGAAARFGTPAIREQARTDATARRERQRRSGLLARATYR